jgi:Animal haem peroxidase
VKQKLISAIVLSATSLTAVSAASTPVGARTQATVPSTCGTPGNGYGELFSSLPNSTWETSDLQALSLAMIAEAEDNPSPQIEVDLEDNNAIPAGFTYFGQFVDHDLTLDDRANDLTTPVDPSVLVNKRTPQLDLDSVYGNGPTTSPTLYNTDGMHLLTGAALTGSSDSGAMDLPRNANGQALIGDARNDENRIVAGIHSLFIRYHNKTVDQIKAKNRRLTNAQVFAQGRREVTNAYQWIVLNDYLPQIAGQRTRDAAATLTARGWKTNLHLYNNCAQMPVEFAVAAYRFGHSQVRALYKINQATDRVPVFSGTFVAGSDLTGFSPSPSTFAIDWNLFLPSQSGATGTFQPSYKIDGSLTNSLSLLPLPTTGVGPANLALRNLLRGQQVGLASGQDVARAMGVTPLTDDQIKIGAATGVAEDQRPITDISANFAGKAPLWVYVLAEAAANPNINRLGPVGSRIVVETIVGLLKSDPTSILNNGSYRPKVDGRGTTTFGLRTLVDLVARA